LLQTLLPSLTRRFALHGDPKKFACLRLPTSVEG
jgi:hypothetical protein